MQNRIKQLGIVGVGMIGASIAAAVKARKLADRIVGFSPGEDAQTAFDLGLIDTVCAQASDCLIDSDLIVLSAPVGVIIELMPSIASQMHHLITQGKPVGVITDTGSSKQLIIQAAEAALGPLRRQFVAAHPIAGSERRGALAANPELFAQRSVLLCQSADQAPHAVSLVSEFWQALGARTEWIEPMLHDEVYAEVSHWPHAAAFALCLGIARGPFAEQCLPRAGAGLKDSTRIAGSDPALWADILLSNREATLTSAQRHLKALEDLIENIEREDRQALTQALSLASSWRQQLKDFA